MGTEYQPYAGGTRFVTYNAGYTEGEPKYGMVIPHAHNRHWRVIVRTNGAGREFFDIDYHVRFDGERRGRWVPEHIVSGRGEAKGGPVN
jgi:hypothetical protein